MGTQFTSRLKARDAEKVLQGVRVAWQSVSAPPIPGRPRRKTAKAAPAGIDALSPTLRRKLGDVTMAQVLRVAEEHSFTADFHTSRVFVAVLDWLKELVTNAKYNGFQGFIDNYDLDSSPSPSAELTRRLDALVKTAEGGTPDPFRVDITTSARTLLGAAMAKVSPRAGETAARALGRQLADFTHRDVVERYIRGFVVNFVESLLGRADPHQQEKLVRESRDVLRQSAERIARRAVKKVEDRGQLVDKGEAIDSDTVRDIVFEELQELTSRAAPTPAET